VVSGLFQGMPVGGSMSASSLVVSAGARTRTALLFAAATMAIVIVLLAEVVGRVAMPALAGLLIVVGYATVKPRKLVAVARTGPVPLTVMALTLVLTLVIPLQYAVLVGVGMSVLLFVIGQSSRLTTRRLVIRDDGQIVEEDPPELLEPRSVVALQPYGAVFFATASVLVDQMPTITPETQRSVVILRLRGTDAAGATVLDVLDAYADALAAVDSRLVIVTDNERFREQLAERGLTDRATVYAGTPVVGETVRRAIDDAVDWIGTGSEAES
jgi:SulP family sulfate permease